MNQNTEVNLSEEIIEDIDYLIDTILAEIDFTILKYQSEEENLASMPYDSGDKTKL